MPDLTVWSLPRTQDSYGRRWTMWELAPTQLLSRDAAITAIRRESLMELTASRAGCWMTCSPSRRPVRTVDDGAVLKTSDVNRAIGVAREPYPHGRGAESA